MNQDEEIMKAKDLASTVSFFQKNEKTLQTAEGIKAFLESETKNINVLFLSEKYIKDVGAWPQ